MRWQPLKLPEVPPAHVHALTAFYRRRHFPKMQIGGHALSFAPQWQRELPEVAEPWTLSLKVDEKPAEILIPGTLLRFLIREVEAAVSFDSLSPDHRALILEFVLADRLDVMETVLGCAISLVSVRKAAETRKSQSDLALPIGFELQSVDRSWCILRIGEAQLHRVARGLDRIASPPSLGDLIDLDVPAHLRWGSVDLTLAELMSLRPGDIVLVESYCQEPETALAVIGDHLMAPVKVLTKGYQLMEAPKRILGSGFEWSGDYLSIQSGPLRDGRAKDLPVRVFFELAQLSISSTELKELARGAQIGGGTERRAHLDLVVRGTRIGSGELTTLGIGLGVRIARI
jgi:type III secretion system YscQ/HrcQ family protein